jgi:hypothetical protein
MLTGSLVASFGVLREPGDRPHDRARPRGGAHGLAPMLGPPRHRVSSSASYRRHPGERDDAFPSSPSSWRCPDARRRRPADARHPHGLHAASFIELPQLSARVRHGRIHQPNSHCSPPGGFPLQDCRVSSRVRLPRTPRSRALRLAAALPFPLPLQPAVVGRAARGQRDASPRPSRRRRLAMASRCSSSRARASRRIVGLQGIGFGTLRTRLARARRRRWARSFDHGAAVRRSTATWC